MIVLNTVIIFSWQPNKEKIGTIKYFYHFVTVIGEEMSVANLENHKSKSSSSVLVSLVTGVEY